MAAQKSMKHPAKTMVMIAVIASVCLAAIEGKAQHVFVKDGKIYEGKISGDTRAGVTMQLKGRGQKFIPRGDILRVLYSDEYQAKTMIQLAGGETFEGFIVNETRENYTIRMRLNEPVEKVIAKVDIARTEKKRPSKLAGRITDKGIRLTWGRPNGPIKVFIVYSKRKGEEYRAVDKTNKAIAMITAYNPDTEYFFTVRMVDNDNYESPPSNEIAVRTLRAGEKAPEFKEDDISGKAIGGAETRRSDNNLFTLGIGVFGTGGVSMQYWNRKNDTVGNGGGGIVLDTAMARDSLRNYRFTFSCEKDYGFRYRNMPVFYSIPLSVSGSTIPLVLTRFYKSKQRINPVSLTMSHAFGFGVVRTKWVRFWLGPELSFSFTTHGADKLMGGYAGFGLIVGLNINLGDYVSLSLTESAMVGYAVQSSSYTTLSLRWADTRSVPSLPVIPVNPLKKEKSLENGFAVGGQLNFAVLYRINDTYSGN
ncbi:MAG: fibronectin type III domain-containing protein [Spirochaetes bacterium]|nr:fibronectin type III domain-containing protein [Spirochaetota bacterium]